MALAEQLRQQYGLGGGLTTRLAIYVWNTLHLDLGFSVAFNQPVLNVILQRLPVTLLLMLSALSFAFAAGTAGRHPRRASCQPVAGYIDLDARPDLLRRAVVLVSD